MKRNHDIIELSIELMHETDGAYLFDTGRTDKEGKAIGAWVPKSMCEYDDDDLCLQLPEWLALDKGII